MDTFIFILEPKTNGHIHDQGTQKDGLMKKDSKKLF